MNSIKYIPAIDGLRAVAVLAVFLFHLYPTLLPGGFVGVDIFFVISGFLISKIIITQLEQNRFSFKTFYTRRIYRIFPALFCLIFFSLFASFFILGRDDYADLFKASRYASAQISNFLFSQQVNYFDNTTTHSPLLHTWSLGVEEQFYLIWPLLIWSTFKLKLSKKLPLILITVVVLSLWTSITLTQTNPMQAFYLLHSRAWQLALGGLIFFVPIQLLNNSNVLSRIFSIAGMAAIAYSVTKISSSTPYPGYHALVPTIGSALLILSILSSQKSIYTRLLSFKPLVGIGKISYSLYLWHWPPIAFFHLYKHEYISPTDALFIIIFSFTAAYLSYRYIETPFRSQNFKWAPKGMQHLLKRPFVYAITMIILFILASNVFKTYAKSPLRFTKEIPRSEFQRVLQPEVCSYTDDHLNTNNKLFQECSGGDQSAQLDVALWGDSHGEHFFETISLWAKRNQKKLRLYVTYDCPPLAGNYKVLRFGSPVKRCNKYHSLVQKKMADKNSPKTVILAARMDFPTENSIHGDPTNTMYLIDSKNNELSKLNSRRVLKEKLSETVAYLKSKGKRVILMQQVPVLKMEPIKCLESSNVFISKLFNKDDSQCFEFDQQFNNERLLAGREIINSIASTHSVEVFDPHKYLKKAKTDKQFLYYDDDHLSLHGSQYLSQFFNL